MADGNVFRVLFLCTGNSARSIMAEATLNARGAGACQGLSAGSHPTGQVNPAAIRQLQAEGIAVDGLYSKSWDEFAEGPPIDLVITVCDAAAGESCPAMPGRPPSVHWGIPDPAAASDSDAPAAFAAAWRVLDARITAMLDASVAALPADVRRGTLERIALDHPA